MGKNVYVTPKNRNKWHEQNNNPSNKMAFKHQSSASERAKALAEKYKAQKNKQNGEKTSN